VPWWGEVLRAMLLWPLFAAFHARLPGVDPFVLTFISGCWTHGDGIFVRTSEILARYAR